MSTFEVIQISKQGSATYIIVSDNKELKRDSFQKNNLFREESEKFLREKYGDHISILSTVIDHQGETQGSSWVSVDPITPGILETIAENYSLKIEVLR